MHKVNDHSCLYLKAVLIKPISALPSRGVHFEQCVFELYICVFCKLLIEFFQLKRISCGCWWRTDALYSAKKWIESWTSLMGWSRKKMEREYLIGSTTSSTFLMVRFILTERPTSSRGLQYADDDDFGQRRWRITSWYMSIWDTTIGEPRFSRLCRFPMAMAVNLIESTYLHRSWALPPDFNSLKKV